MEWRRFQEFQTSRGSFHTLAETVFQICTSQVRRSVHIVFDLNLDMSNVSIKNRERAKRTGGSSEGVGSKNILPKYPIKSWKKVMAIQSNKTNCEVSCY